MATIDTELYDALRAANVPDAKARAAAALFERRLGEIPKDFVTNTELGVAVDRLESKIGAVDTKIDAVAQRLDTKIDGVERRLDIKIDGVDKRLQMLQWAVGLVIALCLGILWKLLR